MLISKVKKVLPYILETNVATILIGQHGIGKSQIVKQYCQENDLQFIDLRLGTMSDAGDLIGLAEFTRDKNGKAITTDFVKPSFLPTEGKGVLFLDEINRAPNDLIQPIFQLVLDRKMDVNGYVLPEGWKVLSAMNPPTDDYTVTNFNDLAFNDRFCFLKVEEDFKGFMDYAKGKGFDRRILDYLNENPGHLNEEVQDFDISQFAKRSSRSWEFVNKIMDQNPPEEQLFPLLVGVLGLTTASSFRSSMEREDKPIQSSDVFNKIKTVLSRKDLDRSDKLKVTFDQIFSDIGTKDLTKKKVENLIAFLLVIPKDDCIAFLSDISKDTTSIATEKNHKLLRDHVFSDDDFLTHVKNATEGV